MPTCAPHLLQRGNAATVTWCRESLIFTCAQLASPLLNAESRESPAAWHEPGVQGRTRGPIPRTFCRHELPNFEESTVSMFRRRFRHLADAARTLSVPRASDLIHGEVIHRFIHRFEPPCRPDGLNRLAFLTTIAATYAVESIIDAHATQKHRPCRRSRRAQKCSVGV